MSSLSSRRQSSSDRIVLICIVLMLAFLTAENPVWSYTMVDLCFDRLILIDRRLSVPYKLEYYDNGKNIDITYVQICRGILNPYISKITMFLLKTHAHTLPHKKSKTIHHPLNTFNIH